MPTKIELLQEANRRGILPENKRALYDEAVKRGLIKETQVEIPEPSIALAHKPIIQMPMGASHKQIAPDARYGSPMSVAALDSGVAPETGVRPGAKIISELARPTISGITGAGGAMIGTTAGPGLGTVIGGGIGYSIGEEIADKLDEFLGLKEPGPLEVELKEASERINVGGAFEAGGMGLAAAAGPAFKFITKKIPKLPLSKAGAEKVAGKQLIANTTNGPIVAKNYDEARALEEMIPGLKFRVGQLTNDPGVIKWERARARMPGDAATGQAEQQATNTEAITKYIERAKGKEGLSDVKGALQAEREAIGTGVTSAEKTLEKESLKLGEGMGIVESGQQIKSSVIAGGKQARKVGGELFEDVPQFEIEGKRILDKIDEISEPFTRMERIDKTIPEEFEWFTDKIKETGGKVTPQDLQDMSSDIGESIAAIKNSQASTKFDRTKSRRLAMLKQEVDDVLKETGETAKPKIGIDDFERDYLRWNEGIKESEEKLTKEFTENNKIIIEQDNGIKQILHKSTRDPGKYQLTTLQKDGSPSGHETYDTLQKAVDQIAPRNVSKIRPDFPDDLALNGQGDRHFIYKGTEKNKMPNKGLVTTEEGNKHIYDRILSDKEIKNFKLEAVGHRKATEPTIQQARYKGKIIYPERLKSEISRIDKKLKTEPHTTSNEIDTKKTYKELSDKNILGIMQNVNESNADYTKRIANQYKIHLKKDAPLVPGKERPAITAAKVKKAKLEKILSESVGIEPATMAEASGKLKAARKFWKEEVVEKFGQGAAGEVTKKGSTGDKVRNAQVAEKFFKPKDKGVQAADDFINAVGDNKEARQALEDYIKQDLLFNATNPLTGEVTEAKLKSWLKNYYPALKKYGLEKRFNTITKARNELDTARKIKGDYDSSVASTILDSDVNTAVKNAFSKGPKGKAALKLMSQIKGDKRAIPGLQNALIDHIIDTSKTTASDAFGNPIISYATLEKGIEKYQPAMDIIFKNEPGKLKALYNYRNAMKIMQRGKASPLGNGSDSAENLITAMSVASGIGKSKAVNIVKAVIKPLLDMSDNQVNALLNRASYDPDFAYTLMMMSKGAKKDIIEQRLKGHMISLGLKTTKGKE